MNDVHSDTHDLGLAHDLDKLLTTTLPRRRLLQYAMAGGASLVLGACSDSGSTTSNPFDTDTGTDAGNDYSTPESCLQNAEETAGPYPGDGSNTVNGQASNILQDSGVVRRDITSSFGSSSTIAKGVPLNITLKLLNVNAQCASLPGYVVYLWHCTQEGAYSLYSEGLQNENFLRGVQVSDANGVLTFQSIFPGCYAGRYPHIHFEVYSSLEMASLYTNKIQTSQIALPREACDAVYASDSGYSGSVQNLDSITVGTDNVFSDNSIAEIAVMTMSLSGDVATGYNGNLTIGVPA